MTGLAALLLVLGLASAALAMKWYERALDGPLPARALSRTVFAAALVATAAVLVLFCCDAFMSGRDVEALALDGVGREGRTVPVWRPIMEAVAFTGFAVSSLYAYGAVREDRTGRQGRGQVPARTGRPAASAGEDETKGDSHVQTS